MPNLLSAQELDLINAYWRAANYLSIGQIYLFNNPLLKKTVMQRTCPSGKRAKYFRCELFGGPVRKRGQPAVGAQAAVGSSAIAWR